MKLELKKKVKYKILLSTIFLFSILVILTPAVLAERPLNTGFDKWGYNYQAHIFNGWYLNSPRPDTVHEGIWGADGETWLQMKWNDAWLSKELERPDPYIGSGAWLTNLMIGWYLGDDGEIHQWEYFVKIVAVPADAYLDGTIWYTADGTKIGDVIWVSFAIIQQVDNDPYAELHGISYLSPVAGFGYYM